MTIQRNDWSLQRKGIIDQERHKERVTRCDPKKPRLDCFERGDHPLGR